MIRDECGSVLVLSIILITTLLLIVTVMFVMINNEILIADYEKKMVQVQYTAESALEYAKYYIDRSSAWETAVDEDGAPLTDSDGDLLKSLNLSLMEYLNHRIISSGNIAYIYLKEIEDETNITVFASNELINKTIRASFIYQSGSLFDSTVAATKNININSNGFIDGDFVIGAEIIDNLNILAENGLKKVELGVEVIDDFNLLYNEILNTATYNTPEVLENDLNTEIDPLTINNEIWYLSGITINRDLKINGNGIILIDSSFIHNGGKISINYDEETGRFTSGYVILLYNGINAFPFKALKLKGLLYTASDVDINEQIEICGGIISAADIILNNFRVSYDNAYVSVLKGILEEKDISCPERLVEEMENINKGGYKIIDWQES